MDLDYKIINSTRELHKYLDSYSSLQTPNRIDLSSQFVAARPKHPAVKVWKEFITEYYGFESDMKIGVLDLLPMPTFFQDHFVTVGSRAWTFALYSQLGK